MPFYEVVWPPWTLEEDIMLVYFCSRAFELLDVTRIMAHRLHRAVRNRRQCITHMERLNRDQEHKGLPRLCSNGMAFWDRAAVDAFLIDSTPDTYLLEDLLTFHWHYEQLLGAWRDNGVPMNEVLNVTHLRIGLRRLIETHRRVYGRPSRFRGHGLR